MAEQDNQKNSCLAVIPARYESVRLPGKPLADINGKSLIERVYERTALSTSVSKIVVATDDERIRLHCAERHIPCTLTDPGHTSGSDRVAEIVANEEKAGNTYALVANVQGDMPFLNPLVLDTLIIDLANAPYQPAVATVAVAIDSTAEFQAASDVKVVFSTSGRALYFSRSPIPYQREAQVRSSSTGFKHLGLYVYTTAALKAFTSLKPTNLEVLERLEQLRLLQNDLPIHVSVFDRELLDPAIEVDTPEDLENARAAALLFDC